MKMRELGRSGVKVSAVGLGCMGISAIANEKKVKSSQLALAWVLAQGTDIVPIPGTTRRDHLDENLAALDIKLSKKDLKRIDEVAPKGATAGLRYPEAVLQHVNG